MKTGTPLDNDILKVHRADYLFWCATHSSLLPPQPLLNTSRQSASAMVLQLPPELLLEIFSYLMDSQATLYEISMVCRSWMACVSPLLYRHAKMVDTYRWATFIVTLTRTKKMLDYGAHVQSVCLFVPSKCNTIILPTPFQLMEHVGESMNQRRSMGQESAMTRREVVPMTHNTTTEHRRIMGATAVLLTTSSLRQLALSCKNLTKLDLAYTTLIHDNMIAETGEYVSTLQHYAIQRDLTQIPITIESVIELLGLECSHLKDISVQRCEWVTTKLIWLMVMHCPVLERLDARRADKGVVVKKLTLDVLEKPRSSSTQRQQQEQQQQHESDDDLSPQPFEEDPFVPNEQPNDDVANPMGIQMIGRRIPDFERRMVRITLRLPTFYPHTLNNHINFRHDINRLLQHYRQQPVHINNTEPEEEDMHTSPPYSSNSEFNESQSLKDVVYTIIKEAKELGTSDLDWFIP